MYQASNIYVSCGFAAIGGGLFGFDISSMSGVLGTQAYKRYFNNPVSYAQGGITASMPAGSLAACFFSSYLADRFSRKIALQISSVCGLCIGIASSIVPVYQSEIAPKEIRGRVVSLQQWAITWGILIQYFVQFGAAEGVGGGSKDPNQPTAAFRIPWAVQITPALFLLVGLFFFPYSPRWLATKGRWDEARKVLAHLHGKGNENHPRVLAEFIEIRDALEAERKAEPSSFKSLFGKKIGKRVLLGMSIQAYYIVYIMEGAQIASPLATASIQYVINVVMTMPAIWWIDKWGRRWSLILGSFGMMSWLFISGALQHVYGQANTAETRTPENSDISWIVLNHKAVSSAIVACSYLFVATFATTWGPVSWTYPAEIFPSKVRATAVSISTAANWFWNMVLAFAVPPLLWNISFKMYYVFAAFNGAACIHMFLCAHETKGITLEEMDTLFDSGMWAFQRGAGAAAHAQGHALDQLEAQIQSGQVPVAEALAPPGVAPSLVPPAVAAMGQQPVAGAGGAPVVPKTPTPRTSSDEGGEGMGMGRVKGSLGRSLRMYKVRETD
ncbi:high affinity glucose transporter [Collariella sp. IMI 366227]|nr:high affinity glucose transporter [Collariella sp. IMI 366227]